MTTSQSPTDINETKVTLCETITGYTFHSKLRCLESLQASGHSLLWQGQLHSIPKNDRLAVLGNAVSKAHLCARWFGTGQSKGQWSQFEQTALSNVKLSEVGCKLHLEACVVLNTGTVGVSVKTMATTVEAILGAVFLDGGEEALGRVIGVLGMGDAFLGEGLGGPDVPPS